MDESNQQASSRDVDLSWLAAAIESEGWFIFHISDRRKKGRFVEINPQVGVCNTDWAFVQACNDIIKKWITGCHLSTTERKRNPKHLRVHRVICAGMKRTKAMIDAILPYMRHAGKIRRAKLLLEFIDHRMSRPRPYDKATKGRYKPFSNVEIALLIELKKLNNPTRPIAKGTLEKLQRLKTQQYKITDDIVQAEEIQ
jgi:hypothetical protein